MNGVPIELPRLTAWTAKGRPTRLAGLTWLSAKRLAGARRHLVPLTGGARTHARTGLILILLGDEYRLARCQDARLRIIVLGAGSIRAGSIRTGSICTGSICTGPIRAGPIGTGPIGTGQPRSCGARAKGARRVGVMTNVEALPKGAGELRHLFAAGRVLLDQLVRKLLGLLRLQPILRELGDLDFVAASRQNERSDLLIGRACFHPPGEAWLARLPKPRLTGLTRLSNARPRRLRSRGPGLSAGARLQGLSFVLRESGACQAH